MIEIARRAGVGTATLYRRFPTRDDLFELVFEDRIEDCSRTADRFLDRAATEPGEAFAGYVRTLFDLQREDRAFTVALLHAFPEGGRLEQERQHAMIILNRLIESAQAAGALRRDFTINDMELLLKAHDGVLSRDGAESEAGSRRITELLLDACLPPQHNGPLSARDAAAALHVV